MRGTDGLWRAARKIEIVLIVLCVSLTALSCGVDGKIFGAVIWDYILDSQSIGGFPISGTYGVYYEVDPGTYNVYYTLWDGGSTYSPGYLAGYPNDPGYYWIGQYTVEADKGSFPLVDGKDQQFALYLTWHVGMLVGGAANTLQALSGEAKRGTAMLGTQTWTGNGLRVTVTNRIVKLTSAEVANLGQTHMEKK